MKSPKLLQQITVLPKKVLALLSIAVLTMPVVAGALTAVTAAPEVTMEGNTKVLNVTKGETTYKDATNANVDEVVQVQLWHHNRQMPTGPKANNVKVKLTVPSQAGKTQVITGTTSSDNGNTITDTAQVNLSLERAKLDYIPGTAYFRYNKGAVDGDQSCITGMNYPPERCYASVKISDDVVFGSGVNLDAVRGTPLHGCNAYHETVSIQLRSKADAVSVNKYVRHAGETGASSWKASTEAKPGDDIEYLIKFKNEGNTVLKNVMVGDNLPKYNKYIPGTTKIQNSNFPNGIAAGTDNIVAGGINVGNYAVGSTGYVWFKVKLDGIKAYEKCTTYDIRNVGIVQPEGMNEYYNTAQVKIDVDCDEEEEEKPEYACELLTATKTGKGREVKFTARASATNGASVSRYVYNFGDGSTELVTDKTEVSHTYAKDGSYTAKVSVQVRVNNQTKTADSKNCEAPVSFATTPGVPTTPTTPGKLPETGAGSILASFLAVTSISSFAYYLVSRRFA